MFVAIDKATAVRMHEKVRKAWATELTLREQQFVKAPEEARSGILDRLDWMRSVDMAVIVSRSQNEIDDLKQRASTFCPTGNGCRRRTLKVNSRTPTTRSGLYSCVRCGSPASMCRHAAPSISTSR
jgi:type I restriction enzyme, R subunit